MPYINVQITRGATREQKERIVREITRTLQETLGKKPEHTHVVIHQVDEDDWGYAGMLTSDWKHSEQDQQLKD